MTSVLRPVRQRWANGLTSLVQPLPHVHRTVLTFYLRTGSRFETKESAGISHFLEHMLFRGTPRFPSAHELATAFEDWGGTLVASTAADHGNLAIAIPPENLSPVLEYFAEVLTTPLLRDLELERGIIREEIFEDLGEDGQWIDGGTLIRQLTFGSHGLGLPITGPLENIEDFTEAQIRAHHELTYVGEGAVVSVAGPCDADQVTRDLGRALQALPPGTRLLSPTAPLQTEPRFQFVRQPGSNQTSLHVAFRSPGQNAPLEPALEMLLRIIDDGMATRLYHTLCDTRGLCYDAAATYEAYEDTGLVEFVTNTAHERAAQVLEEILRITSDLAEHGPTERELSRAQKRARWQHEALLDDPAEIADFLAMAEFSQTAPTPDARLSELLSLSRETIHQAAREIFQTQNLSVVAVGNPPASVVERLARITPHSLSL